MKAILEFNLPEEEQTFERASNAENYWLALYDIKEYLRGEMKHGNPPHTIEIIYDRFWEIVNERVIQID